MPITRPTYDEMVRRAWNTVSQQTGLTNDSESGFAINILKVFCAEMNNLWSELEFLADQGSLSTATGINLDSIGQFFGVTRKTSLASTTVGSPSSVLFTNNTGSSVTISPATKIWPSSNPNLVFNTVFSTTISAGQQGYIDVRADAPGEFYNIGARVLDTHNLGIQGISVTNILPISNGQNLEDDNNYRVRIQNEIFRKEGSNLIAIREALLEIPGIRDVQILNLHRGTGTLDVLIYGYDRIVPQAVIDEAQIVLDNNVAAGVSGICRAPIAKLVDVVVKVKVKDKTTISVVRPSISLAIRGYLDNLPIEDGSGRGFIIYSELASRVQQSSSDIIDSNITLTIDNIPTLRSNQILDAGERFISNSIIIG